MSSPMQQASAYELLSKISVARMQAEDLHEVQRIENDVYPFPWTAGNFTDSLSNAYQCRVARAADGSLAGYFLLMPAVDEAHLLNITVRRDLHGTGIGRMLLDQVMAIARAEGMMSVLLEVRPSNGRALAIYERYGFMRIGMRRGYYPSFNHTREDAVVMRMPV
jgi:[ribosomal protein S18]-alanine N-acetyltransferase